jgi:hypothetical protein
MIPIPGPTIYNSPGPEFSEEPARRAEQRLEDEIPDRVAMHIVYRAHSYREDDAAINRHFGILIEQAEGMIVNFDPPSDSVNESKLQQNLRSCDGMVAVLTWRATGPSPYILFEIGLALRSRKPVLVFLDDRLPGEILSTDVMQQRFSHRTYFRQVREHIQRSGA